MKYIQVLAYGPNQSAEPTFVGDDLATMQEIVGGLVQISDLEIDEDTFRIIVYEDAQAAGRPRNRYVGDRLIYGHMVLTRGGINTSGHWKFKSLTLKQVNKLLAYVEASNARPQAASQAGEA